MTSEQSPYGGEHANSDAPRRVRTRHFHKAKSDGLKFTALTSYDALTAKIFDQAGIDMLLVGDSAGNTVFGYDSTLPVTVDELIPLTRAVANAAQRAFVVADMPFGSYESGPDQALATAIRFMKETGVQAVKLEGGVRSTAQIERIVQSGIPVVGHIGYTPQSEHGLGGHIIQGRGDAFDRVMADALAVQAAGAFAIVLEMVPASVGKRITQELAIPTIGIGAGPDCDGQILVWQDWAGLNTGRVPKFVRQYASIGEILTRAAHEWQSDVRAGNYPGPEHSYE